MTVVEEIRNAKTKWEDLRAEGHEEMPEHKILPDEMDWAEVWEDYVDSDPGAICGMYLDEFPTVSQIRRMNAYLYQTMGVLSHLKPWGTVLDIGAGHNALELLLSKEHEYLPLDVNYYTPMTHIVSGNGDLPISDNSMDHVVCSNVLQHVPPTIRKRYLQEALRVLKPEGKMFLGMNMDHGYISHESNLIGGKRFVITGDYFVPIADMDEFVEMSRGFTIISKTERSDGYTSFWLTKPKQEQQNEGS